ncbi:methylated-DNA--protein-cysteine methyltransferase [Halobacillus andaensis]|uniref:Methylated-DNA--protein-cysteine methyltransferase n=1 Tax=Halobacillus andaensis TaxID=1176239 RepID=A0A917B3S9_HALAA|nr:methylated-DNA--[protein]-cysteine S-methyltransferase [Halobacillus andaensis]MBP2004240.1 O-6-methylguanine DNA methyltransferase [Halobacillus andaensis]GGF16815.1 methylated-DNA--protein-cysteine methyltransferase [Halobacillus andaensis]
MSNQSMIYYDVMDTPVGDLTILATDEGILRVDYGRFEELHSFYHTWTKKHLLRSSFTHQPEHEYVKQAAKELHEYFARERETFTLPLICYGTPFQKSVWRALIEHIPLGETKSYKDIAMALQASQSVRAVGGAINKNPFSIVVPCHRVIGSNGKLVGYAGGLDRKRQLLELESYRQRMKVKG